MKSFKIDPAEMEALVDAAVAKGPAGLLELAATVRDLARTTINMAKLLETMAAEQT